MNEEANKTSELKIHQAKTNKNQKTKQENKTTEFQMKCTRVHY